MSGRSRTLLRFGAALVVALVLAYAGWRWGGMARPGASAGGSSSREARVEPTPEMAEATLAAVDSFRRTSDATDMALTAVELESLLRYSAPGIVPEGVSPPRIEFRSDRIVLQGRVAVDAFPPVPEVERLVGVLPDTVSTSIEGSILPYEEGRAALRVRRIRVSGVPLPRSLTPGLLRLVGRNDRPGLPPDAIDAPLPAGLSSAYILSDRLVLVAREADEARNGPRGGATAESGTEQE